VLGRPHVDDEEPLLKVDDEDEGRLVGQGQLDALPVPGRGHRLVELAVHRVEQVGAGRDEQAGRVGVVLGLRDQVDGDVRRVGRVVGQDADLGRTGLRVDADDALEQPLGRRHVDVARPGNEVDREAVRRAVGEHRDRLRPADGVHLLDTEQRARAEHHRVRQAVGLLRRAGHGQRADSRLLGGDHVHVDAGGVREQAARHVQPNAAHRQPALRDRSPRREQHRLVAPALRLVDQPGAARGLLEGGPHVRVEGLQGRGERRGRDPCRLHVHPVETPRQVAHRLGAPRPDVLAERADDVERNRDVELGAGQDVTQRLA
jgi:hypothetical protein